MLDEAQRKAVKKRKIWGSIFALSIIALRVAVLIIALPVIQYYLKFEFIDWDTGINPVPATLTAEQRLKDFDYMYDLVCQQNPRKAYFEQAYGFSYDDLYNKYREYVVNSKSEYEFFSYMSCFLAVLPGEHNLMTIPDYDHTARNGTYALLEIYASQDVKDYAEAWKTSFRKDVEKYMEYSLIPFKYVDGKYVGASVHSDKFNNISDYAGGQILTLNGRDPKEMCFEFFDVEQPIHDSGNDCYFRSRLFFNNGTGIKYEAEILMPDGSIVKADLYDDPMYDAAYVGAAFSYRELITGVTEDQAAEPTDEPDTTDVEKEPESYYIAADPERKLVYFNWKACRYEEGDRLVEDLKKALQDADAESVIVDLRENSGGDSDYCHSQVLPVLFNHDVEYASEVIGRQNEISKQFYNNLISRFDLFKYVKFEDGNYIYSEDLSVNGKAEKNYRLYVLTSQKTFSSGDMITNICKQYDNAVIIGTNTGGEGIAGALFNCYLPESRFMFAYAPGTSIPHPEDSYCGTEPDVYMHQTVEDYLARMAKDEEGVNSGSYEVRMEWDTTLNYVIDEITKAA